jgi:hypothetical protein
VDNIKAAGIGEPLARAYMCSQGLPSRATPEIGLAAKCKHSSRSG